eukprot:4661169-Ditylum_brightwellii.AAC.1
MGFVFDKNAENVVLCPVMTGGEDTQQSVQSTLGGGNDDHLGLVLTPAAYQCIPGTTPYTRPTQPLPNLPAGSTNH